MEPEFKVGDEVIIRKTHKQGRVEGVFGQPTWRVYVVNEQEYEAHDLILAPKPQDKPAFKVGEWVIVPRASGQLEVGEIKHVAANAEQGFVRFLNGDQLWVSPADIFGFDVKNMPSTPGPTDARKDDQDKLRFDLIPPGPLQDLAAIYTMGAKKYADRNWEKGLSWGRVFGAVMRHLWAFWKGEDNDPKSGLPHLAHAAWGCFALLEYRQTHPEMDDRPRSGK